MTNMELWTNLLFLFIIVNACVVREEFDMLATATDTELNKHVCHGPCHCIYRRFSIVVDCSHGQLQAIPPDLPENTTELQFSYNKLTALNSSMFNGLMKLEILNISFNEINDIEPNTFSDLGETLTSLYLTCNRVRYMERFRKALTPLLRLKSLYIQQCLKDIEDGEVFPANELKQMPHLTNLSVDLINKEGFPIYLNGLEYMDIKYFKHDPRIPDPHFRGTNRCNLPTLSRDLLANLTNVRWLRLNSCNISKAEIDCLVDFDNIISLDLSFNVNLGFTALPEIMSGLQNKDFEELVIHQIHDTFGDCTKITKNQLKYFQNVTSFRKLIMSSNRWSSFEEDSIEFIPKEFQYIDASQNLMLLGNYFKDIFSGKYFSNVKFVNISTQRIKYGIKPLFFNPTFFVQDMWQNREAMANNTNRLCPSCQTNTSHVVVPLPQKIEVLDISQLDMDIRVLNLCICEPNSLREFYMRKNKFRTIEGPLMGMKHVQLLDLSNNACANLSSEAFHFLPNLTRLYLSGNLLGYSLERDEAGITFQNLSRLEELDLSFNELRYLPFYIFKGLTGLEMLILKNNNMKTFAVNMQMMTRLNRLVLNNNNLRYIPKLQMKQIDKIIQSKSLRINLANNKFKCNCTDTEFVRWIQNNNVNLVDVETYICTYIDDTPKNITGYSLVHDLEKECASYTLLIVVASILVSAFLSILTGGIIYRYRWDLRYLYYSSKFRMKGYMPVDADEDRFRYDIFVSYSDQERHFVVADLVHELEESRSLKLCIHEREFFLGGMVTENIVYAINNSRKTLVLLSKGFIESHWCRYELNMARMEAIKTGRDVLCTVKMEEIIHDNMPLEVIDVLRNHTYIQLPEEREHMTMFWDRLYTALS
ncbi:toll-like receptor 4 [Mya arenaria]|uniref:toll-like receptor 4 n=1 Tax=Mya arenaria TaxID=6604 RepID=UPI0022E5B92B|nr:toll-like receptor 4 [Mya arenaria]